MHINDFDFTLPENLIAQHPPAIRGASRLLLAPRAGGCMDQTFADFPEHLQAGDVLVLNNTQVIKARLFGQKTSGGKIEALIERVLDAHTALAHVRSSKSPKAGTELLFEGGLRAQCIGREGELFVLRFEGDDDVYTLLEQNGHLPLPPYITRSADDNDDARYQTVFAREIGAVAAPTAGLHFTPEILQQLRARGVEIVEITLHVGAGTFQPVRVTNIAEHHMHRERFVISPSAAATINAAKQAGKKICAAGTTSLRALESAALSGSLQAGAGETEIFITPGFRFQCVDMLLTNFHLPKSTLLMLVSAFAGTDRIRALYRHAIEQEYRFFSYGDAMLLYQEDR
ncbi:MAG: tRNA preQ1(34) S-adenosylmethionine ribosyltransferase-isomerase QueA [Neisseria sp.]|nr:tRNA preQ1(34) S-adenosylmethionine ribosyltransferase-isomerase QueA [Neisseria sp.]